MAKIYANRYKCLECIGRGGMASVYLAFDRNLQRQVALKVMHEHMQGKESLRGRFRQEAYSVSKLKHPNILEIYDFSGADVEDLWLVMEYIEGYDLNDYTSCFPQFQIHPLVASCIIREVGKALSEAHKHGIIHRDVKSSNIMVSYAGQIKLMDFGIAKDLVVDNELTQTGSFIGSPSYMPPEQVRGEAIDVRADIYALSVLFFKLLTGKLPYEGDHAHQIMDQVIMAPVPKAQDLKRTIPSFLSRFVHKGMAKEPQNRHQAVRGMVDALDRYLRRHHLGDSGIELELFFYSPKEFAQKVEKNIKGWQDPASLVPRSAPARDGSGKIKKSAQTESKKSRSQKAAAHKKRADRNKKHKATPARAEVRPKKLEKNPAASASSHRPKKRPVEAEKKPSVGVAAKTKQPAQSKKRQVAARGAEKPQKKQQSPAAAQRSQKQLPAEAPAGAQKVAVTRRYEGGLPQLLAALSSKKIASKAEKASAPLHQKGKAVAQVKSSEQQDALPLLAGTVMKKKKPKNLILRPATKTQRRIPVRFPEIKRTGTPCRKSALLGGARSGGSLKKSKRPRRSRFETIILTSGGTSGSSSQKKVYNLKSSSNNKKKGGEAEWWVAAAVLLMFAGVLVAYSAYDAKKDWMPAWLAQSLWSSSAPPEHYEPLKDEPRVQVKSPPVAETQSEEKEPVRNPEAGQEEVRTPPSSSRLRAPEPASSASTTTSPRAPPRLRVRKAAQRSASPVLPQPRRMLSTSGALEAFVTPSAAVYIGKNYLGLSHQVFRKPLSLKPGPYRLTFQKSGYQPYVRDVVIKSGQKLKISKIRLTKITYHSLAVQGRPGTKFVVRSLDYPFSRALVLQTRQHHIKLRRGAYQIVAERRGRVVRRNVKLPSAYGDIVVSLDI